MFNKCQKGKHSLITIFSHGSDQDLTVVRWCEVCGAIVIDKDYDNRTNSGAVLPMKFPSIVHDKNEAIIKLKNKITRLKMCAEQEYQRGLDVSRRHN